MRRLALVVALSACGSPPASPPSRPPSSAPSPASPVAPAAATRFAVRGAEVLGHGVVDLEIDGGVVAAIGAVDPALPGVDARGRFIAPAFIDSHVHLAYYPAGEALLAGGVAAAVDLAAPLAWLAAPEVPRELMLVASGPMITARRGYPTRAWGEGGYGLEVGGPREATAAVDELHARGARVIKLPITGPPVLAEDALRAAVERAHGHFLKVVSHALLADEAAIAAAVGVDALAHTPVEPLPEATIRKWSGRAVISTLAAFGGAPDTIDNLRRLRAAGAVVLYGTDFGNTRDAGISGDEIDLLLATGLDGQAILDAGTRVPAAYWGLLDAQGRGPGTVTVGGPASFLILRADPRLDPRTLAAPEAVYIAGARRGE